VLVFHVFRILCVIVFSSLSHGPDCQGSSRSQVQLPYYLSPISCCILCSLYFCFVLFCFVWFFKPLFLFSGARSALFCSVPFRSFLGASFCQCVMSCMVPILKGGIEIWK
jgi:hypothetical protein